MQSKKMDVTFIISDRYAQQVHVATVSLELLSLKTLQTYYEISNVCKTAPWDIRYFNYYLFKNFPDVQCVLRCV